MKLWRIYCKQEKGMEIKTSENENIYQNNTKQDLIYDQKESGRRL